MFYELMREKCSSTLAEKNCYSRQLKKLSSPEFCLNVFHRQETEAWVVNHGLEEVLQSVFAVVGELLSREQREDCFQCISQPQNRQEIYNWMLENGVDFLTYLEENTSASTNHHLLSFYLHNLTKNRIG